MKHQQLNEQLRVKYTARVDNEIINQVHPGPVKQRKCTDIICLILFILFVITFIGFLVYFIISGSSSIKSLLDLNEVQSSQKGIGPTFIKSYGAIIGMIALSCGLAIIFIILCAKFPKCVVITGIIFTFLCYLAVIILAFAAKQWALAIGVSIAAVINAIMLFCWREQIKVGIVLLKASGTFMMQKPSIALIGIISMVLNLIFLALYVWGWMSAYTQTLSQNNKDESSRNRFSSMMIFFIIMGVYFGYFLYYLMVFVLSTAVAYWYYQQPKNVLYGYKTVAKHVGTLGLAALLITIISILRRLAQRQFSESGNLCMQCLWCLVSCLLKCIEGFIEVLNHNSIIVMSVTGENFINSAKTTLGLIYNNFPLFWIVDFIADLIQFYSLIICVLAPAIIAGGIIWSKEKVEETAVVGGVIVFLLAWILTSVILGLLYEALSSVFIMFCLDKKLRAKGFTSGNVPQDIKHLFNDVGGNDQNYRIQHDPKPSTETNLAKNPYGSNPNLDSQPYFDNQYAKQPQKSNIKRKLSKNPDRKQVNDKSMEEGQISMQENSKPQGNEPRDPYAKQQPMHPFYSQQAN